MAKTTSSVNYLTAKRPKTGDPLASVTYDAQNRPTVIVYNVGFTGNTETVNISYTVDGFPIFNGIEYRNYQLDIWKGILEKKTDVSISGTITVVIELADGFATQKINVGTSAVQIVNTSDRISIAIRNWSDSSSGQILYLAEDNTTLLDGWPMISREGTSIDLDPNASLFLVASSGTIDTRILEVTRA